MSNYKYRKGYAVITCGEDDYRVANRKQGVVLPDRFSSQASAMCFIDRLIEQQAATTR